MNGHDRRSLEGIGNDSFEKAETSEHVAAGDAGRRRRARPDWRGRNGNAAITRVDRIGQPDSHSLRGDGRRHSRGGLPIEVVI